MLVSYGETLHQARFTAFLSLEEAASAAQFQRLRLRFSDWLEGEVQGRLSHLGSVTSLARDRLTHSRIGWSVAP